MPKIKVKTPTVEIEVEGDTEDEVKRSLKEVLDMMESFPTPTIVAPTPTVSSFGSAPVGPAVREGTINTAIARLGGDTCKAVLEAAAAHLALFQGRERFNDEEWEETARAANSWKVKWSKEKAKIKNRLIASGFVIENSAGVYSLSSSARGEMEAKLAH